MSDYLDCIDKIDAVKSLLSVLSIHNHIGDQNAFDELLNLVLEKVEKDLNQVQETLKIETTRNNLNNLYKED